MKIITLALVFSCSLFVAGCTTLSRPGPETDKQLEGTPSEWRARGKFSYRSETTRESGNFDWRQQGADFKLRLYGPLGLGSVRISGNNNLIRIQSKEQDISSDQPLNLLYRTTGLEIPLHSMPKWLLGQPASLSPSEISLDKENRIQSFKERTWRLSYSNFEQHQDQNIPMTIDAFKDDIHLRMLVYHWEAQ